MNFDEDEVVTDTATNVNKQFLIERSKCKIAANFFNPRKSCQLILQQKNLKNIKFPSFYPCQVELLVLVILII